MPGRALEDEYNPTKKRTQKMLTPRTQKSSWSTPREVPVSCRRAGSPPPHAASPAGGEASPGRQTRTRPTYQLVRRSPPRGTDIRPEANKDAVRPDRGTKGPPDAIPQPGPQRQPITGVGETQRGSKTRIYPKQTRLRHRVTQETDADTKYRKELN